MSTDIVTAPLGRRLLGLFIDWVVALAISAGFFAAAPLATLTIFAIMTWLLLATRSATIGHTLSGLLVTRLDGGPVGPGKALIRTVALCLVIPAVVWGLDGRGMHDVWAGTAIRRRP